MALRNTNKNIIKFCKKKKAIWVSEIVQQVKTTAAKPGGLSSILRAHTLKGKTNCYILCCGVSHVMAHSPECQ